MSFPDDPVCILSIGTSVPDSVFTCDDFIQLQTSAANYAISKLNEKTDATRIKDIKDNLDWVISCAKHSGIDKRHGIVPDEGKILEDFYRKHNYNPPYTLRAKYWRQYCPKLAMQSVEKALATWGGNPQDVTHVVSHSTTGWDVPGLSHHVIFNLKLPTSARAIPVNFVGCQGGTSVMYVATMVARNNPNAVILAIAAEIQSPLGRMYNDQISLERSIYMPNVLFGDAAACAVIGRPSPSYKTEFPAFEIGAQGAHYCPDTRHVLTIAVSDEQGLYYENSIKKELPVFLNAALSKNFPTWLKTSLGDVSAKDCAYAVHPGGLKLLENFSKLIEDHGVENGKEACKYSFQNLQLYGNLASAAILFILNDVCKTTKKDTIYFMAMGPGVCLEYGGLRRYKKGRTSSKNSSSANSNNNTLIILLVTIIFALIAVIVSGGNLKNLL